MLSLVVRFIQLKGANMKAILSFLLTLISFVAVAQQTKVYAVKNEKGIFVEHKVQPKENWYSVGRLYAISPKEIAAFNGLTMEKGLSIGQALKVPLTPTNFIQSVSAVGIPVYHLVEPKEGLLKVASTYGLNLAGIKNLNNLSADQINTGYNLIVGYIGAANSSVASSSTASVAQVAAAPVAPVPVQETKSASPVSVPKQNSVTDQPKEPAAKPVVKDPEPVNQPVVKPVVKTAEPAAQTVSKPAVKNTEPVNQPKTPVETKSVTNSTINYFSTGYGQQAKEGKEQKLENPTYGIFKSSSGWQDGKYYMLMNDVVPGTIVKVSAIESGKTIHAKVLGAVPPGKESEGMQLRLSNAAASVLGVEQSGSLSLVWFK